MTPNASFSFKDEFNPIWKKFQFIAKREGKNASRLIREFVSSYVTVHGPGNPQTTINNWVEGGSSELSMIEGKIREQFRQRSEKSIDIRYLDILQVCKDSISSNSQAHTMAIRIEKWLKKALGLKVWR